MQISVIGTGVVLMIFAVVFAMRLSVFTALMISLAFGSTSFATLTSLGGSSPLIYTIGAAALVISVAARRHIWKDIGKLFGSSVIPWVVCALMVYVVVGALFFPRLFAGQTTVFVVSSERGGVFEVPLAPVSGNFTQAAYLVLGGVVFLATFIFFQRGNSLSELRRGFLFWASMNAAMGVVDLAGKLAGFGDVLLPIRTANYALLTEASQGIFWRITGGQSEASSFGGVALASLAFTYSYWRKTGNRYTFWLSLLLVCLLILSTSSTAYVGLGILCIPVVFSIIKSLFENRLDLSQIFVVSISLACLLAILFVVILKPDAFRPFEQLVNDMVVNKLSSSSGQERSYWNYKSLQSFVDTGGFGVGIGSSRASSWLIAVISQLGIAGAIIIATLVLPFCRPARKVSINANPEDEATIASVRMCALAGIVTGSLISGTADPGIVFFVSLAAISAYSTKVPHGNRWLYRTPTSRLPESRAAALPRILGSRS